jgi:hypothetical protein
VLLVAWPCGKDCRFLLPGPLAGLTFLCRLEEAGQVLTFLSILLDNLWSGLACSLLLILSEPLRRFV